ncbi:ribosome biogenesis GTPase Der, partial [bacterium]|nr:ribosome biogenesis GTPase Der [bacterium]
PNVGKSTLFNRILRRRRAIEDDRSGVTRDRISEEFEWNGVRFNLVDTGGLVPRGAEGMDELVSKAAEAAIVQADRLVFVVDGKVSPTDVDQEIARSVLKHDKPVILAVTKIDNTQHEVDALEYYALGLGDPMAVSGVSGLNTGDLLDLMVEGFEVSGEDEEESEEIRVALIGRPNVGKSSILNKLLGEERQIVSDIPGTTRDAIDFELKYKGKTITLIDTAGLRRKKDLDRTAIEYYTILRTIRALDQCEIAVLILDANEGLTQYDRRLIDQSRDKKKGIIAVYNKWDLVEKETGTLEATVKEFYHQLPDLSFMPLLFTSALTGQRLRKVYDQILEVDAEYRKRVSTADLNRLLEHILNVNPPPAVKGRWLRIKYVSQIASKPPLFAFFMNLPELVPEAYKRYLQRMIREEFGFTGVPIQVVFRKK